MTEFDKPAEQKATMSTEVKYKELVESYQLPGPYVDKAYLAMKPSGVIRITFAEEIQGANKGISRAAVTLSPAGFIQIVEMLYAQAQNMKKMMSAPEKEDIAA